MPVMGSAFAGFNAPYGFGADTGAQVSASPFSAAGPSPSAAPANYGYSMPAASGSPVSSVGLLSGYPTDVLVLVVLAVLELGFIVWIHRSFRHHQGG